MSRFDRWDDLASVRRRPRRPFAAAEPELYFPPELYPVVRHPLVTAKGSTVVNDLLLQRLYDYLEFTTELETLAVIPVATKISRGRSGLVLSGRMRSDAYKIVTDEAWHAQFSHEFVCEIEAETRVPWSLKGACTPPAFLLRLDEIRGRLPQDLRGVEGLLFAIVSETLISGMLSQIPRDDRLPLSVRNIVRDHAEDEGRHHVYFRTLLTHLWPALGRAERQAVGPLIPAVVYAFLEPDYAQTAHHLRGIGLTGEQIDQVITESWPTDRIQSSVAAAASQLTRYLSEVGALGDKRTLVAFEEAELMGSGYKNPGDASREFAG
ncbi:diiron oxygenase (plasmid) [Streptomyces scopuliridis]|uniref:diiron oxygenase n=1 Tax=Streptomyces scopuliridis TaxID=452529 RepID=UPI002DDB4434|nr:diiron oxygenase [Streptomyces scopuliridis]WSB39066.1 diiron oxygenase [Streptomyces scopuliridis]